MVKYIVFCTTNMVDNRILVGIHATENPDEFDGYIGDGVKITLPATYMRPSSAFQFAVKKYGTKNFNRVTLGVYDSLKDANDKFEKIVDDNFINMDSTYNIKNVESFILNVNQFDVNGKFLRTWKFQEALEFFNCPKKTFKLAISFKGKLFGYYWGTDESINVAEYSERKPEKILYKYTKNGKMLEALFEFSDIPEEMIKNQWLYNGYYYSFKLTDKFQPKPRIALKNQKFYLYDLGGNFLKEFPNCKEMQQYLHVHSNIEISRVVESDGLFRRMFQIKTEKFDRIPPAQLTKQLDVFNGYGKLLGTFDTVRDIVKKYNLKTSSVNKMLKGLVSTVDGYIIKYH